MTQHQSLTPVQIPDSANAARFGQVLVLLLAGVKKSFILEKPIKDFVGRLEVILSYITR